MMEHRTHSQDAAANANPDASRSPALLQYWPASHDMRAPGNGPESFEFDSVEDAVAFAMTQAPNGREIAWLRTPDGEILKATQIRRLWELRRES